MRRQTAINCLEKDNMLLILADPTKAFHYQNSTSNYLKLLNFAHLMFGIAPSVRVVPLTTKNINDSDV